MRTFLLVPAVVFLVGGTPDDDFRSERQILRHLTGKLAQFGSDRTEASGLSRSVSKLQALLEQMTTRAADLKYQDGRVHGFQVMDLEPKSHVQARLERESDARLKTMLASLDSFLAANTKRFGPQTPEFQEARRRTDDMVKEIQRVDAEKTAKVQEAILTYAAAQKEYAVLLDRQREAQTNLDQVSAEFQSLRGTAVNQLNSLESPLLELRRAGGAAEIIHSVDQVGVQRPLGSLVFDSPDGPPTVALPDVATPEGSPAPLVLPVAPSRRLNSPKAQALRVEAEALQVRGRLLEAEKVRLFSAKTTTSEEWMSHSRNVQKLARDVGEAAIITRGLGGSELLDSELLDMNAMDAKAAKEPPSPRKEAK